MSSGAFALLGCVDGLFPLDNQLHLLQNQLLGLVIEFLNQFLDLSGGAVAMDMRLYFWCRR